MSAVLRIAVLLLLGVAAALVPQSRGRAQDAPPLDPAARKAVGRFLENLADEITRKAQQQAEEADQGLASDPDPVDERALVNREQRTQLQRAERLLAKGERTAGLRLLQHLLNAKEDSLLLTDDGQWRSLHAIAEEKLLRSDPQTQRAYRDRYAKIAEEQLRQARAAGNLQALAKITRRYFATPAGATAANEIASLMIDAGHPAEAAYWFRRLIDAEAPISQNADWRGKAMRVLEEQEQASPVAPSSESELTEWPQPFGGPTHTGRAAASNPVLIERWSQPLTDRPQHREQITQLVEDLQDDGLCAIPAAIPLAVDGKIVYRTLRGLSVIDASSGERIWESPEGVSVERLLAGEPASRPATETDKSRLRPMGNYQGNGADQHALTNLLFRDGVYGLVSSDGERVFALEDHATLSYRPPGYYRGRSQADDPHGRDWETNRLVAYDLDTGRIEWSIGGPEKNGRFAANLAGTLFQGPPVVAGNELFLIGEQHGAEVLFVLDRRSGEVLWSHMLCGVSAEVEYDLVRRWWPAQPAVGKGVIICPTTVGWVVAIDRLERRVRWAHRLTERRKEQRYARQSAVAMTGPLNSRWCPSAPLLVGRNVVVTPSELPDAEYHTSARVVCLDTMTGEQQWEREKESTLYLGGVWRDALLLVGSDQVELRQVVDGRRLWRMTLPEGRSRPSGRGLLTGSDFLLPLQTGELWRINIADGSVAAEMAPSSVQEEDRRLGNLILSHNQIVSLSPLALTSFDDRDAVESLLTSAKAGLLGPEDRLRAAELEVIDGNHRSAIDLLHEVDPAAIDSAAAERARHLQRESLIALIREDPASADVKLSELERLAETPQHSYLVRQLQAEQHASQGEHAAAFEVYWKLSQESSSVIAEMSASGTESDDEFRRLTFHDGDLSIRLDRCLSARLTSAWAAMSPEERESAEQHITTAVDDALQQGPPTCAWWAQLLRFHPQGRRLEEQLVIHARQAGRLAEAEIRLLRFLKRSASPAARGEILLQLVDFLKSHDRPEDAAWYFSRYAASIAEADPQIGEKLAGWREQTGQLGVRAALQPNSHDWSSQEFALTRASLLVNRHSPITSLRVADGMPSLDRFRFQLQSGLGRLAIDAEGGDRYWETPLRSHSQAHSYQGATAGSVGGLLFVVHQGVLHALGLFDRELLWQQAFDTHLPGAAAILNASPSPPDEMATATVFRSRNGLTRQRPEAGLLAISRPDYLCYLGRNHLTAADPLTGKTLWTRRGIRPQSRVFGNNHHVFVIPTGSAPPFAVHSADGSLADFPDLEESLASAIGVTDDGLVTLEINRTQTSRSKIRESRLNIVDPATSMSVWEVNFPKDTLFAMIEADTLLAIEPSGNLRLVNWSARRDRLLCRIDPNQLQEAESAYALSDGHNLYMALNSRPDRSFRSDLFLSVPVHGVLLSVDLRNGDVTWESAIKNQHLLLEEFHHLPVIVMLSRHALLTRAEVNAQQVELRMLDKWSGETLLAETRYVSSVGSFRSVDIDLNRRIIDFQGSRERLRIQPADIRPSP